MKIAIFRRIVRFGVLCATVSAFAFSLAVADSGQSQSIRDLFKNSYSSAVNNEDASAFAALFSEDGIRIPPNRPPEGTRDGIRAGVERVFEKFDFNVDVSVEDVDSEGNFAWASVRAKGERTDRNSGKSLPVNVRYVVVMKQSDSGWEIFRQTWYPIK